MHSTTTDLIKHCTCLTDSITITSATDSPFVVSIDGNALFEKIEGFGAKESFGYSTNGIMQPNTCDEHEAYNRVLRAGSLQRNLFNLITRFSRVASLTF